MFHSRSIAIGGKEATLVFDRKEAALKFRRNSFDWLFLPFLIQSQKFSQTHLGTAPHANKIFALCIIKWVLHRIKDEREGCRRSNGLAKHAKISWLWFWTERMTRWIVRILNHALLLGILWLKKTMGINFEDFIFKILFPFRFGGFNNVAALMLKISIIIRSNEYYCTIILIEVKAQNQFKD